ncbi:MAG: bifunctional phosphoglucose/phosphomannose isomerase [Chloroflexi bacterium]|nr:bifunctional phosphoglucose/phosphomannose isomerase [Chloroflexota bacterium]
MSHDILDDKAGLKRLDPHGMLARIEALPEQCEEAWRRAAALRLPETHAEAQDVVLLGMGGSAISNDILRSLAALTGRKPVQVVRGYDIPASVGENTLVVACSHSGNTEETLSAFQQAIDASAKVFVITTGGEIAKLADQAGAPVFRYEYEGEPRSSTGHQLMALLALGERVGLLESQEQAVSEAVALMQQQRAELGFDSPRSQNPAKQLAERLQGRLPVIVGAGVLDGAAYRWKTQINENSKSWALHETLPELDHNSIVGFGKPDVSRLHVVFLRHAALHPRLLLRYEATGEAFDDAGVSHETVEAQGTSALAQVMTAIYFGDLTSYYLALLNGVQPATVEPIDTLKAKLTER